MIKFNLGLKGIRIMNKKIVGSFVAAVMLGCVCVGTLSSCSDDKDKKSDSSKAETVTYDNTTEAETEAQIPATAPVNERYKVENGAPGDVNADGIIDVGDVTMVQQYLSNPDDFPLTDDQKKAADVVGDGDGITAADVEAIQNFISDNNEKLN